MNKIVISVNPDRLKYLNYDYTLIQGETDASSFVLENMKRRHNESTETRWYKGKCGCFTSHIKVLEYIVENQLNNVVILEDDAIYDPPPKIADLPQDEPTLLAGILHHPKRWSENRWWKKSKFNEVIKTLKEGINEIDYNLYRWTGTWSIYYPKYECCKKILDLIYFKKKLKHFDLYLSQHHLVKYLHYPSIYTHDDTKTGSSINLSNARCILKNYDSKSYK